MPRLMASTVTAPGRASAILPGSVTDNVTEEEFLPQCSKALIEESNYIFSIHSAS